MKLSDVLIALNGLEEIKFQLPNGTVVPQHFHVTEIGEINKKFIDCGGTIRNERKVNFQLWEDESDIDHRLKPQKLTDIIQLSMNVLDLQDAEIEVEYQSDTIGKYNLGFENGKFLLQSTMTDCLAKESCGIPVQKEKVQLNELVGASNSCAPGSGCC